MIIHHGARSNNPIQQAREKRAVGLQKANMNQTNQSSPGGEFVCPKCGARYQVTLWPRPKAIGDYATCQNCHSVMLEWYDSVARSFKRIDRLEL